METPSKIYKTNEAVAEEQLRLFIENSDINRERAKDSLRDGDEASLVS